MYKMTIQNKIFKTFYKIMHKIKYKNKMLIVQQQIIHSIQ